MNVNLLQGGDGYLNVWLRESNQGSYELVYDFTDPDGLGYDASELNRCAKDVEHRHTVAHKLGLYRHTGGDAYQVIYFDEIAIKNSFLAAKPTFP
jgi:hypothetical protein